MYIDCHVHCRDEWESRKETIAHALEVARDSGLSAIFDMGNLFGDPVTTRKRVLDRFALVEEADSPVIYGSYILLTKDPDQIREAVETWREFGPHEAFKNGKVPKFFVPGLKMFAGKSVGDCTISGYDDQKEVYNQLVKNDYRGVLVTHCEKESKMKRDLWDPSNPITHSYARPEEAEVESVKDQLKHSIDTGFATTGRGYSQGSLHIAHISVPESVDLVNHAKRVRIINVTCGATPHHLLLNQRVMRYDGLAFKVNPPLRKPVSQEMLLEKFLQGEIDLLESDHAPHTEKEKFEGEGMSGIPNLASWPLFLEMFREEGASEQLIEKVAYKNVNKIFGTKIPRIHFHIRPHKGEYAFEPYENLR
ncbi:MAG: dihydroorotase [archaeon]